MPFFLGGGKLIEEMHALRKYTQGGFTPPASHCVVGASQEQVEKGMKIHHRPNLSRKSVDLTFVEGSGSLLNVYVLGRY